MPPGKVLQAISGIMAAFFVVMLSGTVVATSLPVIVSELHGSQTDYTWVVTANFLTMTVTTPIWGKLADRLNRKALLLVALASFAVASVVAGFAADTTLLIICRLVQGAGVGGVIALGQVVVADVVSPRERGKYMGVMGAVMGVAQLGGPLVGGVITDLIGWRWNFFLPVPVAIAAMVLIMLTLRSPKFAPQGRFDYLGAVLIVAGFGMLLAWLGLGGTTFAWESPTSIVLGISSIVLVLGAIGWELCVREPIIPLRLFGQRTFVLATIAALAVGVTMFSANVFVSQYLQVARGYTPTESGFLQMPLVVGSLIASVLIGQLITRTGRWKLLIIGSAIVLVGGLLLLGAVRYDTPIWLVGLGLALIGLGTGGLSQNLVLVIQNTLKAVQLGAGTGAHTFVRSLGGTIGITLLGAVLTAGVGTRLAEGLAKLSPEVLDSAACAPGLDVIRSGALPNVRELCQPLQILVESVYGDGIAAVFLLIVPLAVIGLIAVALLPNRPLSKKNAMQQLEDELRDIEAAAVEGEDADEESPAVRNNGRHDDG